MSNKKFKLLFLTILFLFIGCEKKIEKIDEERFAFGTYFKISVFTNDKKKAKIAIEKAFDEIGRIDSTYNSKVDGSEIDKLNKSRVITLNEEGLMLLSKTKEAYEMSGKKYDVTIEPLMKIWGFSEESFLRETLPTEDELEEAKSKVSFSKIKIQGNQVTIDSPEIIIDTGSFLKGYAVERAKEVLKKEGITSGFITAISSIEAIGKKGDGTPWKIGVQNPSNPSEIIGVIELDNQSMAVSGDYQTYIEIEGKKYHHLMDKETGYPVKDKKMVVVVNKNGLEADSYSTAFFLMPIDKVLDLANSTPDFDVLIVDSNDEIYISDKLKFKKSAIK